jgi:ketosteroid isomerase-like protein
MVWKRLLALTALVVMFTACPSPAPEGGSAERRATVDPAARQALMDADRAFAKAFADRGVEGWVSYFDEKGVQMPGGAEAAWGHDQIEALARRMFAPPNFTSLSWEPVYAQVAASADLGYTLGTYVAKGTNEDGEELVQRGNYLTVWRKQEDGSWKVAVDTGNPGPPLRVPEGWE